MRRAHAWAAVPCATLLLALGSICVPRARRAHEPIDWLGALLLGAALLCLTVGLGQQSGTPSTLDLHARAALDPRFFLAALLLPLAFVVVELRLRWPVMSLTLFRAPAFAAAAVLSLLIGVVLVVALVEIPLFAGAVLGASPLDAGLALLRMTVCIPVGALAGGWLSNRLGCPPAAALGVLLYRHWVVADVPNGPCVRAGAISRWPREAPGWDSGW